MQLTKSASGIVFDDQFATQNPSWDLLNASSISFSNKLMIEHSAEDSYAVIDIPQDAQAFEAFLTYTPISEGDAGGLVLFNTSAQNYKLLEVADATLSDLENIKVVRNSANHFDLYMLRDGEFTYIDSVSKEINKIGFVLKGGEGVDFVPFEVNRFIATKSDKLIMEEVVPGYRIELTLDGEKLVATANEFGVAEFTLKHLAGTYDVGIYNTEDVLVNVQTVELAGGDVFYLASLLTIRENSVDLATETINHMGSQQNGLEERRYELHNPTATVITNIMLQVKQYANDFGYELVDIALDVENTAGTYADELIIPAIQSNETINFWIKLNNTTAAIPVARFTIALTHD